MIKTLVFLAALFGGAPDIPTPQLPPIQETCRASYYGTFGPWHGTHTATGERFRPKQEATAAHRTLPFGTMVLVERVDGPQAAWVRINDRGPYVVTLDDGRHQAVTPGYQGGGTWRNCIDLSIKAAKKLDIITDGMRHVRIRYWRRHVSGHRTARRFLP